MEDYGSKTKQLLKNRIKDIQQTYREINQDIAPYAQDYIQPQIYKVQDIEDSMNTNFGNISNIQMPYEIKNYNDYEEEDNEKEIEEQETFCSYVLYFILALILLHKIGISASNAFYSGKLITFIPEIDKCDYLKGRNRWYILSIRSRRWLVGVLLVNCARWDILSN